MPQALDLDPLSAASVPAQKGPETHALLHVSVLNKGPCVFVLHWALRIVAGSRLSPRVIYF